MIFPDGARVLVISVKMSLSPAAWGALRRGCVHPLLLPIFPAVIPLSYSQYCNMSIWLSLYVLGKANSAGERNAKKTVEKHTLGRLLTR